MRNAAVLLLTLAISLAVGACATPGIDQSDLAVDSPTGSLTTAGLTAFDVLRLPRVEGSLPEKSCSVHHTVMTVEFLPILWGLIEPRDDEMVYFAAQDKLFPNAREIYFGGCLEGPQSLAEFYICAKCRRARAAWLAAHPRVHPAN